MIRRMSRRQRRVIFRRRGTSAGWPGGSAGTERPRPTSVTGGDAAAKARGSTSPGSGRSHRGAGSSRSPCGSSSRAAPGAAAAGQLRIAQVPSSSRVHVRAEVEGEADVMTPAADLVDDLERARGPVQPDRAAVPGRRVERQVAVVLCASSSADVADVEDVDLPGVRVPQPEEGTAVAGLALPVELDGVVRDRRPEVRTPRGLTVVAVGARVGEHVDAAVADLHGQRVGVGVRGDAEISVRAAVAAAPDLRGLRSGRAQQGRPGVGEAPRPLRGPAGDLAGCSRQGADDRAARVRRRARPPVEPPEDRRPQRQQRRPAVGAPGASSSSARPSSPSPCRGGRSRSSSSAAPLSTIAHSRCQAAALSGQPAASASTAASRPSSATKHW